MTVTAAARVMDGVRSAPSGGLAGGSSRPSTSLRAWQTFQVPKKKGRAVGLRRGGAMGQGGVVSDRRAPPSEYMRFNVKKHLRVPVTEPASVRSLGAGPAGHSDQALETWVKSPGNVMGVVFTADAVQLIQPDVWRIQVLRLPLLDWELSPEFDLTVLPPEASTRPGGVRMISDRLNLSSQEGSDKLPPGFASMNIWSYIDATLYVDRDASGATAVCADLDISIAADIPGLLRMMPYFQSLGEGAISGSIDVVAGGAGQRVQTAYEEWIERGAPAPAPAPA